MRLQNRHDTIKKGIILRVKIPFGCDNFDGDLLHAVVYGRQRWRLSVIGHLPIINN